MNENKYYLDSFLVDSINMSSKYIGPGNEAVVPGWAVSQACPQSKSKTASIN
jgi:hypothetical protein